MNLLAHNGIDHIHHAHKSAEHANEPNYLLIITVAAALLAGAIYAVSRYRASAQPERAETHTKEEDGK